MFIRILVVILILGLAGLLIFPGETREKPEVLGEETSSNLIYVNEEIARLLKVIESRPDYAAAWLRLSILYEQIGEGELALQAGEKARELDQDL